MILMIMVIPIIIRMVMMIIRMIMGWWLLDDKRINAFDLSMGLHLPMENPKNNWMTGFFSLREMTRDWLDPWMGTVSNLDPYPHGWENIFFFLPLGGKHGKNGVFGIFFGWNFLRTRHFLFEFFRSLFLMLRRLHNSLYVYVYIYISMGIPGS